jgi:hypothetical protein
VTRPAWLDEPHIQAAIARTVAAAPPLTEAQIDLLRRTGFFNRPATAAPSPDAAAGSAAGVDATGEGTGAAGPRDTGIVGEVGSNVGQSARTRPAAPTTKKSRPAATGRLKTTAG